MKLDLRPTPEDEEAEWAQHPERYVPDYCDTCWQYYGECVCKEKEQAMKHYPSSAALEARRLWSQQFGECWCCAGRFNLQTHELASRSQAPGRWADVRNYARLCGSCNCNEFEWLPEAFQLCLKKMFDPENYDRQFVNELRGRQRDAITEGSVDLWLKFWTNRRSA